MAQKLTVRGAVPSSGKSEAFVTNPRLEAPNQRGIGGMDPSVYLSVCRRASGFAPDLHCPLYKVNVPDHHHSSSMTTATRAEIKPRRIARAGVETGVGGKTFSSLPASSGWIIGVGGDYRGGSTTIIDTTKKPIKRIRGPDLLAAKWNPVLAAVGTKVYALCNTPSYRRKPNFVPWFEVLDLSNATVTETSDGSLSLDGCFWEELSCPPCFPRKLTPTGYLHPPTISVSSYVTVLPHYILISLVQKSSCTYVFDTSSGEWHEVQDNSLPFVGRAVPHGPCFCLGTSLCNGTVNAYRIRVVISSASTSTRIIRANNGGSNTNNNNVVVRLSITECSIVNEARERVGSMQGQHIVSLDRGLFSLFTFSLGHFKHIACSDSEDDKIYSTKLFAKLTTYHIENPALLEETMDQGKLRAVEHEITVSKHQEQNFDFFSTYGFSSPPIPFVLSI
ncbi:hypothetical protein QOZ80_5AG0379990 [Eleusine coracana subsp. coracana]|nr:hypothetical protein QOZ80_5AG0379990 [Eleusine coracana subsp. coracana]